MTDKSRATSRFLVIALSLAIAWPSPALALRTAGLEEARGTKHEFITALSSGPQLLLEDRIRDLHRELFAIAVDDPDAIKKYRRVMSQLAEAIGYPIDDETFLFPRIGSRLRLNDPRGSVTHPLFNHVFSETRLNAAMIPIDFSFLNVDDEVKELYYKRLVWLMMEDIRTVGFAAGHPYKDWTQAAIREWATRYVGQKKLDPRDDTNTLARLTAGGLVKNYVPNRWRSQPGRGNALPIPQGILPIGDKKLALRSLMTSGDAYMEALKLQFGDELAQAPPHSIDVMVIGAAGATGEQIARALADQPWVERLLLAEHPTGAVKLRRLVDDLRTNKPVQTLSYRTSKKGWRRLNREVPHTRFIIDATSANNPIRKGTLRLKTRKGPLTVLTLTYRDDKYVGLRYAAEEGVDARYGANLLVTDNWRQLVGIFYALLGDAYEEEIEAKLAPETQRMIIGWLRTRGLDVQSLTDEIRMEQQLREKVRGIIPRFQGDLVPDRIIQLVERAGQPPKEPDHPSYTLCGLIREHESALGLLNPQGNLVYTVTVPTPEAGGQEFFTALLKAAQGQLLNPHQIAPQHLDGIALSIIGQLDPQGRMVVSHLRRLEGEMVNDRLRDAATDFGIQGPVNVINDAEAASLGTERSPTQPTLHVIIRLGGLGACYQDGKQWYNLEPGLPQVPALPGSPTLEDIATGPETVQLAQAYHDHPSEDAEKHLEERLNHLVDALIQLAESQRSPARHVRFELEGELLNLNIYRAILLDLLRRRKAPFTWEVVEHDATRYFRGARHTLQPDASTLLKVLVAVATDSQQPSPLLPTIALGILKEVLSSAVLSSYRRATGDRSIDQIRQAVLEKARGIVQTSRTTNVELLQQAIFTLGALGNQDDYQLLEDLAKDFQASDMDDQERVRGAATLARQEISNRILRNPNVISLVLRRDTLTASLMTSGHIQGPSEEERLTGTGQENVSELLDVISRLVQRLIYRHHIGVHELTGVALAIGATLDPANETVIESHYFPAFIGVNLKQALETKLQETLSGEITVEGYAPIRSTYDLPIWLENDEQALATAEARWGRREGIYIHLGKAEARAWRLQPDRALPVGLPPDLQKDLSGDWIAETARQRIAELAQDDFEQLTRQHPWVKSLLEKSLAGLTWQDRLEQFPADQLTTQLGKLLQGGTYDSQADRILGPIFYEFSRKIAKAIQHLGDRPVTLAGGVVFGNQFVLDVMVRKALIEQGMGDVQPALQSMHPREYPGLIERILADELYHATVVQVLSAGIEEEAVGQHAYASAL